MAANHSDFNCDSHRVLFGFRLWSQNMSQLSLQSASYLTREVYVKPRYGIKLKSDQLLRLVKPLYDLIDSGDH